MGFRRRGHTAGSLAKDSTELMVQARGRTGPESFPLRLASTSGSPELPFPLPALLKGGGGSECVLPPPLPLCLTLFLLHLLLKIGNESISASSESNLIIFLKNLSLISD